MPESSRIENERSGCRLQVSANLVARGLVGVLVVCCASCQKAVIDPPVSRSPANVTAAAPVVGVDTNAANAEPTTKANRAQEAGASGSKENRTDLPESSPADKPQNVSSTSNNPLAGCMLCHVDVEDEFIGSIHFRENVSCKKCHGPSEGHVADENNEVKPDELFARKNVDRLCGDCHECSRPTVAVSAKRPKAQSKVCTDCHGSHAVAIAPHKIVPSNRQAHSSAAWLILWQYRHQ